MSTHLVSTAESTDAELIVAVRAGDTDAYGALFARHRDAADRFARYLVHGPDVDDLVAESFIRVLSALQGGKGPDESFRAYLLTTIRRLHVDRVRASRRVRPTGDEHELDRPVAFVDPAEMRFEQSAAARAFASLPERWQLVLWHLDVEGQKPAEVGPLLGMSANSVSALAYRAREGLRRAYLQVHLGSALREGCRETTARLGAYVRNGLSRRDATPVEQHLDECSRCTGLYLELREVNADLSGVLGPALLGSAFAGYTAATAGASLGAGAAVKLAIEPVRMIGTAVTGAGGQGVVAAAVVATVATAGSVAVATDFGGTSDSRPAASARPTPGDDAPAPAAPAAAPEPAPQPAPGAGPSPSGAEPAPDLAPSAAPEPDPSPPAKDQPDRTPTMRTPVTATPVTPSDYGIGTVAISNDDSLAQRRFTIPVTAGNAGRAADQSVTLTVQFTRPVQFRGVASSGWDCGPAARDTPITILSCTRTLPAAQGATFVAKARGVLPEGTATVRSADDPQPANNSATFRAGPYLVGS